MTKETFQCEAYLQGDKNSMIKRCKKDATIEIEYKEEQQYKTMILLFHFLCDDHWDNFEHPKIKEKILNKQARVVNLW